VDASTYKSLTDDQKRDVQEAFSRLTGRVDEVDPSRVIVAVKRKLEHLEARDDLNEEVRDGLALANSLASELDRQNKDSSGADETYAIALAALQYLIDPWDLIPDDIPEHGLADDAFVLILACERLNEVRVPSASELQQPLGQGRTDPGANELYQTPKGRDALAMLPRGAGQHFARRAKELGLLNGFLRKALFDISRRATFGVTLSAKQKAFAETILTRLAREGLSRFPCQDIGCKHCREFSALVDSGNLKTSFVGARRRGSAKK